MHAIQSTCLDLLKLHEHYPDRYPFLLESVAHGTQQSRYDILFAHPQQSLRLSANGSLSMAGEIECGDGFLSTLDSWFRRCRSHTPVQTDLPYHGGWFVYLAYELAAEIETGLRLPMADAAQTVAYAVRCPAAVIRDHQTDLCYLVAEDDCSDLLESIGNDVTTVSQLQESAYPHKRVDELSEEPPLRYLDAVRKIRDYIIEGDVFQVNLSRQWHAVIDRHVTAVDLYHNLRINNPAPFAGIAQLPDYTVISSSPERLVSLRDGIVQTRPIAGTRPRSGNGHEDNRLARELMGHPKEQAEHIMLIDLERNDLGRVCEPGTIQVDELMQLETYAHVHHIVSNIRGRIRSDISPVDVIRAVFPGGTITGCPKVRCMEIIAELEQQARGAYTGSMGYINLDGSMDLNILIRTLVRHEQAITLRAGAGIVYDSDPDSELQETRAKALGLLRALSLEPY